MLVEDARCGPKRVNRQIRKSTRGAIDRVGKVRAIAAPEFVGRDGQ